MEELVGDLVDKTLEPTKKALESAGIKKEDINEIIMVGGMTRMPLVLRKVEEFFDKKPSTNVNPDEVVAMGAAIQGGVLQGDVKDVLLLDVTPLTLGIETMGGVMTPLIEANTTVPATKSQIFSTAADNQPSVEIHVLQGERKMAVDNKTLGRFMLDNIPPAPRGVPQIKVAFDLDANGILSVKAKDTATGKEQSIKIEASSDLTEEEIEKMKKDAEAHAEEDKKKAEAVTLRNTADTLVFTTEKALKDAGNKITEEERKPVLEKVEALKKILENEKAESEEIKKASEELSVAAQEIGEKLYKAAQEVEQAKAKAGGKNNENKTDNKKYDKVKDAEEVKDDNTSNADEKKGNKNKK